MKNFKNALLAMIVVLISMPIMGAEVPLQLVTSQESPVSFDNLPGDVKRAILTKGNVAEVAEAIRSLNITNKSFHNFISTPDNFITILEVMPYTANAIDLVNLLRKTNMSVVQSPEIKKWLEAANIRLSNGEPIFNAATNYNLKELKIALADKNINLNWIDHGWPIVVWLVKSIERVSPERSNEFIKLILFAGANPNTKNQYGETALALASYYPAERANGLMQMLLDAKADPNVSGGGHPVPLIIASINGNIQGVKLLLKYGANPEIPALNGKRARDFAQEKGHTEIVKLLDEASEKWKLKNQGKE